MTTRNQLKIKSLMIERRRCLDLIRRLEVRAAAEKSREWNEALVKMEQGALERHWQQFQQKKLEIDEYTSLSEMNRTRNEEISMEVAVIYQSVKDRLKHLLEDVNPNHNRPTPKASEIILTKFSGNYTAWTTWRSQFVNKVYETDLPADAKIDLLLGALEGEARHCAGETEHRDISDLERIWAKLESTYDNKYQIILAHINTIYDIRDLEFGQPDQIRTMIDTVDNTLRSLNRFECQTNYWSPMVAVYLLRKLDRATLSAWEMARDPKAPPLLEELIPFLEKRILAIRNYKATGAMVIAGQTNNHPVASGSSMKRPFEHSNENRFKRAKENRGSGFSQRPSTSAMGSSDKLTCSYCNGEHRTWHCQKLSRLEFDERVKQIKDRKLCECCLSNKHQVRECTWKGCKHCENAKHNRYNCPRYPVMRINLLSNRTNRVKNKENKRPYKRTHTAELVSNIERSREVPKPIRTTSDDLLPILGTALCQLYQNNATITGCIRALCDSGSQINLITQECVQKWSLKRIPCKMTISGVGNSNAIPSHGLIDCVMSHRMNADIKIPVRFIIVKKISGANPQQPFNCALMTQLDENELADPTCTTPGPIEALIGITTWTSIIREGILRYHSEQDQFVAQDSLLGWVISGCAQQSSLRQALSYHVSKADNNLDSQLERFWAVDDEEKGTRTAEEQRAEDIFLSTHQRDVCGRYIVTIPFKENVMPLGRSRQTAYNRFVSLENRLRKDPAMTTAYKEFMLDYINSGHLIPASLPPEDPSKSYYVPFHIISKKKFRVVFDASCITSTGVSLNDQQLPGEKLQSDLCETLLLFRTYRFALTADIVKMFRQVMVHQDHWNYQRIFFRPADDQPIAEYFITRVIWGFTSAGFNSVRALRQCAIDEAIKYPAASVAALTNFYMDDFLSGAETIEELRSLYNDMIKMLNAGGFELAKWATSSQEFANELNGNELRDIVLQENETGILGMGWNPIKDSFCIKIRESNDSTPRTKRQVISRISQVYDPTGLFAPVIIAGKITIQEIWKLNIGWDDNVPEEIIELWSSFHQSVAGLVSISVPRWIACSRMAKMQLHMFSDASKAAYGSCAYLRSCHPNGDVSVHLITSRNKVAPVKMQTIPRLELMGAVMSVNLCKFVQKACDFKELEVYYWTDSTIVIHWLKKNIQSLKPFVANRIETILSTSNVESWRHVPGNQNPADLLSRGCSSEQLREERLWWNGPHWLLQSSDCWPRSTILRLNDDEITADEAESKGQVLTAHMSIHSELALAVSTKDGDQPLVERRSTLNSLLRTTAFVHRFIQRIKSKGVDRVTQTASYEDVPAVTVTERDSAVNYWARLSQREFFAEEGKALQENKQISTNSKLRQLSPFLDKEKILRVGGRLSRSNQPLDSKHQIIIHPRSAISKLIIVDAHLRACHGGAQLTMAILRQKYWITNCRTAVKKIINTCVICTRYKKDVAQQLMGSLPPARTNQTFPFAISGVDFAGPFEVRKTVMQQMNLRQLAVKQYKMPATIKCWVVVFVCMTTKAVHLDLAHGLSVEAFLEVFARFTSRRGQCNQLWSDNGTNFVGTNKELQRVQKEWRNLLPNKELAALGTTWQFISPAAPHQGGLWEAGVKSMKHHLRRVMGRRILSTNQFYTILTQIEGCLNSRPLTPLTDDPNDLEALTPGHFLIGRSIMTHPLSDQVDNCNDNRLTLWGQEQKISQTFWRRWKDDYLLTLQKRYKWYKVRENIKPGDLVIVFDENRPPTVWPLGRVEQVHPGKDGFVRNVTVKTAAGIKLRPIQKLCVLPIAQSDDAIKQ